MHVSFAKGAELSGGPYSGVRTRYARLLQMEQDLHGRVEAERELFFLLMMDDVIPLQPTAPIPGGRIGEAYPRQLADFPEIIRKEGGEEQDITRGLPTGESLYHPIRTGEPLEGRCRGDKLEMPVRLQALRILANKFRIFRAIA